MAVSLATKLSISKILSCFPPHSLNKNCYAAVILSRRRTKSFDFALSLAVKTRLGLQSLFSGHSSFFYVSSQEHHCSARPKTNPARYLHWAKSLANPSAFRGQPPYIHLSFRSFTTFVISTLSTGKRKFQMWYFLPPNLQLNLLSLAEAAFFRRGTRTVLCFEVTTRYNVYNAKSVRRYANLVPRSGQVSAGTRYLFFRQRKMLAKEISISTRSEFGHLSDW